MVDRGGYAVRVDSDLADESPWASSAALFAISSHRARYVGQCAPGSPSCRGGSGRQCFPDVGASGGRLERALLSGRDGDPVTTRTLGLVHGAVGGREQRV